MKGWHTLYAMTHALAPSEHGFRFMGTERDKDLDHFFLPHSFFPNFLPILSSLLDVFQSWLNHLVQGYTIGLPLSFFNSNVFN
jgi:hypothetical protein